DGLKARLASLDTTGQNLRTRIEALDHLASEAEKRNETLLFAISRMEGKLEQSRKTVETASRAGELAAAAATTTGDRLVDSVNAALDHARQASREIQEQSFQASETAAKALANLKRAGEEASVAIQSAAISLNTDQPDLHDEELFKEAEATDIVETEEIETQAPQIEETAEFPQSPSRVRDDELFEVNADKMAAAILEAVSDETDPETPTEDNNIVKAEVQVIDAVYEETEIPKVNGSDQSNSIIEPPKRTPATNGSATLSDIIADMEREDSPTLSREETAERLIDRLTESGIKLNEIFKPRDKKRIALAARRGDSKRRVSTRQSAGRQVERVRGRLRSDSDLMALARDFIALEENDALNALENTRESRKHASPRLATYLLLDAALD
ncbi:MAG: hypothetical protein AAGG45_10490, partial [Pseudomonadota bacterium]